MDKCEGCPLGSRYGVCQPMYNELIVNADDCHLTPSDFTAIRKAIAGEGTLFCMASWRNEFQIDETQARIAGMAIGLPPEFYQAWQDQGGE